MRKSRSSTAARACSRKGNFYMQVRLTTPLTRQELAPLHAGDTVLLTGTSIGVAGVIPPLVIGATPFFARLVESGEGELDSSAIARLIAAA